jgi:tetratricopeptide (TPR) repeat protein
MKTAKRTIALLVALAMPVMFAAQDAQPQAERGGPPPRRGAPGEGMPQMPDPSGFFQAQAMRAIDEKGSLLLEMGKTAEAIQALQEVYTLDVSTQSPMYELKVHVIGSLAKAYLAAGQKSQALETMRKLLSEVPAGSPSEAAAWLEAGGVYKKAGMPEDALKAFDRSIELSKKLAASGWAPPFPLGGPRNPHSGPGGPPSGGEHR